MGSFFGINTGVLPFQELVHITIHLRIFAYVLPTHKTTALSLMKTTQEHRKHCKLPFPFSTFFWGITMPSGPKEQRTK